MYYLLENNKIYNTDMPFHKNYPYWQEEDGKLICVTINNKKCSPCKHNRIVLKSKNKYNLICPGDLIIGNTYGNDPENLSYICSSNIDYQSFIKCGPDNSEHLDKYEKCIREVYKQDFNGNYIRVI